MPKPKQAVETLRSKLDAGERGGEDRDRDLLLEFSDELMLRREEYGWHRHEKLLRHCTRMSEHAGVGIHETLVDDTTDFEDAKDSVKTVVRWIHDTYDIDDGSQETNRDYRVAIRMFARHVTRGDEIPDTHDWISTKTSRNYSPEPDAADMLNYECDVEPMIEVALNERDKALIALQYEGGFRGGELFDLQCSDITDGDHSLKVRVDGKRGEHDVHLIISVPYVQQWLNEHPGGGDDPLWTKLSTPEQISYQQFLNSFKEPAGRADVDKPVTPTNFRKSNAYWLATRGKSQHLIEDRQGRARGSPVIARYVAKFAGETQEKQYAAMHGIDVAEETTDDVTPVPCPRCGKDTPRQRDWCMHCHQSLDLEAKQLVDSITERLDDEIVNADDAADREDLVTARRTLRDRPSVMDKDDLHELASSLGTDD